MKVLILGAGGSVGKWVTRCLSQDDRLDLYGLDDSEWNRYMMECPKGTEDFDAYDLVYPTPSALIEKYCEHPRVMTPHPHAVRLCADKARTAEHIGDLAPKTYWVRDTGGSGGKGAQMASEYLPGRNFAVEMLFIGGTLRGVFAKERLSYNAKQTSDIVTGTAAVARCIDPDELLDLALAAVECVTPYEDIGAYTGGEMNCFLKLPHGIFTVDFKENEAGEAKVTEINAGKFATSSFPFYFTSWNLPLLAVQHGLGISTDSLERYPLGEYVIRGYDSWPFIGNL